MEVHCVVSGAAAPIPPGSGPLALPALSVVGPKEVLVASGANKPTQVSLSGGAHVYHDPLDATPIARAALSNALTALVSGRNATVLFTGEAEEAKHTVFAEAALEAGLYVFDVIHHARQIAAQAETGGAGGDFSLDVSVFTVAAAPGLQTASAPGSPSTGGHDPEQLLDVIAAVEAISLPNPDALAAELGVEAGPDVFEAGQAFNASGPLDLLSLAAPTPVAPGRASVRSGRSGFESSARSPRSPSLTSGRLRSASPPGRSLSPRRVYTAGAASFMTLAGGGAGGAASRPLWIGPAPRELPPPDAVGMSPVLEGGLAAASSRTVCGLTRVPVGSNDQLRYLLLQTLGALGLVAPDLATRPADELAASLGHWAPDVAAAVTGSTSNLAGYSAFAGNAGQGTRRHSGVVLHLRQSTGPDSPPVVSRLTLLRLARASAGAEEAPSALPAGTTSRSASEFVMTSSPTKRSRVVGSSGSVGTLASSGLTPVAPWVRALSDIMSAVERRSLKVRFEDSKVTQLLRGVLIGSEACTVVAFAPNDAGVGPAVLRFAQRLRATTAALAESGMAAAVEAAEEAAAAKAAEAAKAAAAAAAASPARSSPPTPVLPPSSAAPTSPSLASPSSVTTASSSPKSSKSSKSSGEAEEEHEADEDLTAALLAVMSGRAAKKASKSSATAAAAARAAALLQEAERAAAGGSVSLGPDGSDSGSVTPSVLTEVTSSTRASSQRDALLELLLLRELKRASKGKSKKSNSGSTTVASSKLTTPAKAEPEADVPAAAVEEQEQEQQPAELPLLPASASAEETAVPAPAPAPVQPAAVTVEAAKPSGFRTTQAPVKTPKRRGSAATAASTATAASKAVSVATKATAATAATAASGPRIMATGAATLNAGAAKAAMGALGAARAGRGRQLLPPSAAPAPQPLAATAVTTDAAVLAATARTPGRTAVPPPLPGATGLPAGTLSLRAPSVGTVVVRTLSPARVMDSVVVAEQEEPEPAAAASLAPSMKQTYTETAAPAGSATATAAPAVPLGAVLVTEEELANLRAQNTTLRRQVKDYQRYQEAVEAAMGRLQHDLATLAADRDAALKQVRTLNVQAGKDRTALAVARRRVHHLEAALSDVQLHLARSEDAAAVLPALRSRLASAKVSEAAVADSLAVLQEEAAVEVAALRARLAEAERLSAAERARADVMSIELSHLRMAAARTAAALPAPAEAAQVDHAAALLAGGSLAPSRRASSIGGASTATGRSRATSFEAAVTEGATGAGRPGLFAEGVAPGAYPVLRAGEGSRLPPAAPALAAALAGDAASTAGLVAALHPASSQPQRSSGDGHAASTTTTAALRALSQPRTNRNGEGAVGGTLMAPTAATFLATLRGGRDSLTVTPAGSQIPRYESSSPRNSPTRARALAATAAATATVGFKPTATAPLPAPAAEESTGVFTAEAAESGAATEQGGATARVGAALHALAAAAGAAATAPFGNTTSRAAAKRTASASAAAAATQTTTAAGTRRRSMSGLHAFVAAQVSAAGEGAGLPRAAALAAAAAAEVPPPPSVLAFGGVPRPDPSASGRQTLTVGVETDGESGGVTLAPAVGEGGAPLLSPRLTRAALASFRSTVGDPSTVGSGLAERRLLAASRSPTRLKAPIAPACVAAQNKGVGAPPAYEHLVGDPLVVALTGGGSAPPAASLSKTGAASVRAGSTRGGSSLTSTRANGAASTPTSLPSSQLPPSGELWAQLLGKQGTGKATLHQAQNLGKSLGGTTADTPSDLAPSLDLDGLDAGDAAFIAALLGRK